ncbi:MAG: sigma-70 family RNA polymerase sigma factor [Myxococcota bacterium]
MPADDSFIEEHRPLVAKIVTRLRSRYDLRGEWDDLMAYGFKGLLEARERFDPSRGVRFEAFAYYRVRGAIIDGVRASGWLPTRAYRRLKAAQAALYVGEEAAVARAADPARRKDRERSAAALRDAVGKLTTSFLATALGQEDDRPDESPEAIVLHDETKQRLRALLRELPPREAALVRGYYFEGRRFDHIARELGISKSWASRLHGKALARLREGLEEAEDELDEEAEDEP